MSRSNHLTDRVEEATLLPCPFCGGEVEVAYAKRDLVWIEHRRKNRCSVLDGVWAAPGQWNTRAIAHQKEKDNG